MLEILELPFGVGHMVDDGIQGGGKVATLCRRARNRLFTLRAKR